MSVPDPYYPAGGDVGGPAVVGRSGHCWRQYFLLDRKPHYGNSEGMNDDAPDGIRRDLPPVQHSLRCLCARCIHERQAEAEARRRAEEARREERRGREMAFLESLSGPVYGRLGLAKAPPRPSPGSLRAIAARYGRGAR
jgi:hypothetical protein